MGNLHQACVVPKPRLFAQKNAANKLQKLLFRLEECGVVLGQKKNERESTKREERRDQKERAGRKGMSGQDGHGARSCSSSRQRNAAKRAGTRLPPLLGLCGSAVTTMGMGNVMNKITVV